MRSHWRLVEQDFESFQKSAFPLRGVWKVCRGTWLPTKPPRPFARALVRAGPPWRMRALRPEQQSGRRLIESRRGEVSRALLRSKSPRNDPSGEVACGGGITVDGVGWTSAAPLLAGDGFQEPPGLPQMHLKLVKGFGIHLGARWMFLILRRLAPETRFDRLDRLSSPLAHDRL